MSNVKAAKPHPSWLPMALDYVPLIIFFGVYKYFSPAEPSVVATLSAVIKSTAAFMVAIVVAAIIAKWRLGRISPMTWLTAVLVIGFGGLTIYFNDQKFNQQSAEQNIDDRRIAGWRFAARQIFDQRHI